MSRPQNTQYAKLSDCTEDELRLLMAMCKFDFRIDTDTQRAVYNKHNYVGWKKADMVAFLKKRGY